MDYTEYKQQQQAIRASWTPFKRFLWIAKILLSSPAMLLPFACIGFAIFVNIHSYNADKWIANLKGSYPSTTNVSKQEAVVNQMYITCANSEIQKYRIIEITKNKIEAIPNICLQNISNMNSLQSVSKDDFAKAVGKIKKQ